MPSLKMLCMYHVRYPSKNKGKYTAVELGWKLHFVKAAQ